MMRRWSASAKTLAQSGQASPTCASSSSLKMDWTSSPVECPGTLENRRADVAG